MTSVQLPLFVVFVAILVLVTLALVCLGVSSGSDRSGTMTAILPVPPPPSAPPASSAAAEVIVHPSIGGLGQPEAAPNQKMR